MSAPRSLCRRRPVPCAGTPRQHGSSKFRFGLLGAVGTLTLVSSGSAADLSARVVPAPIVAVAPVFTWTGCYAGLNAGWGVSNSHRQFQPSDTLFVRGLPAGALLPIDIEGAEAAAKKAADRGLAATAIGSWVAVRSATITSSRLAQASWSGSRLTFSTPACVPTGATPSPALP